MVNEKDEISSTGKFEKLIAEQNQVTYTLRLYIAGNSPRSAEAIVNIRNICESHLKGRYKLEVIDIYQQPYLAKGEQIIAVPTLIKSLPLPLKRIIGDLSKYDKVIFGLDLRKTSDETSSKPNVDETA